MTNDPKYQKVDYEKLKSCIERKNDLRKSQNPRKCSGNYMIFNNGKWKKHEFVNGRFHQFGNSYEGSEFGPGNYTTAIVELEDGQVVEAIVSSIKFER